EAVLLGEGRLDDLTLHLAVERDRDLASRVVLADVDQRVLLGELRQRDAQTLPVGGIGRSEHRLEGRRCEVMLHCTARLAEPIADLYLREPPKLGDLTRANLVSLLGSAGRDDPSRSHLAGVEAVANPHRPGKDAGVRDPVARRAALDLEDARRQRPIAVAGASGEQPGYSLHDRVHTRTALCRAEEDRMQISRSRPLGEVLVGRSE